jgi:hypothetical protein
MDKPVIFISSRASKFKSVTGTAGLKYAFAASVSLA